MDFYFQLHHLITSLHMAISKPLLFSWGVSSLTFVSPSSLPFMVVMLGSRVESLEFAWVLFFFCLFFQNHLVLCQTNVGTHVTMVTDGMMSMSP